jgi:F-type H+-transporting ATPase subunit epsilon
LATPTYHLTVLTAEGELYRTRHAEFVVLPGTEGELGVLDHHVPLVVTLSAGGLRVTHQGGEEEVLFVTGGFADIARNESGETEVSVLADTGERAHEIDAAAAEDARRRAQDLLSQRLSAEEYAEAAAMLEQAVGRIRVTEMTRRRRPTRGERAMRG